MSELEVNRKKLGLSEFLIDNRDLLVIFGVFTALGAYFLSIEGPMTEYITAFSFILVIFIGIILFSNFLKIHLNSPSRSKPSLRIFFFIFILLILSIGIYTVENYKSQLQPLIIATIISISFIIFVEFLIFIFKK